MNYPQYYYPYFSARQVNLGPLHELDLATLRQIRLREEHSEIELAVRRRQELLNSQRIRSYEDQLRTKYAHNNPPSFDDLENQIHFHQDRSRSYQKQRADFVSERKPYTRDQRQNRQTATERKRSLVVKDHHISKEEEVCAKSVEEYQQELLKKIQNTKEFASSHKHKRTALDQVQEGGDIIINKKPNKNEAKNGPFKNKQIAEKIKVPSFSFSAQKNTTKHQTLDVNRLENKVKRVLNNSLPGKKDCSYIYGSHGKKRQEKRVRNSIMSKSVEPTDRLISRKQYNQEGSVASTALRKIHNRLRLSNLVFKDSKLSHKRHLLDHLFNTYLAEAKGRKEIKDKINNNPKVLKKHLLVVTSR